MYFTVKILPIFNMMTVSSLVVKPRTADSVFAAAGCDGRAVALIIFYALEKLGRREFREVVNKAAPWNSALNAVFKYTPLVP